MPELPTQAKSREAGVSKKKDLLEDVAKVIQRMMLLHVQVQKGYVKDTGQQGNFGRHLHSAYTPQVFIMAGDQDELLFNANHIHLVGQIGVITELFCKVGLQPKSHGGSRTHESPEGFEPAPPVPTPCTFPLVYLT